MKTVPVTTWLDCAEYDYMAMHRSFFIGEHRWAVFIGHSAVKHFLSACCAAIQERVPRTQNLIRLARSARVELTDDEADLLRYLARMYTKIPYPDFDDPRRDQPDRNRSLACMNEIAEIRRRLLDSVFQCAEEGPQ